MQDDLEVTGVSRSGRVRKKSSKLMDFESPDDIETRFRRQTPVKSYAGFRQEVEQPEYQEPPPKPMEEAGTASGSESDYYENTGENADSMETDSSGSEEGSTRTPANSLYMMEKSNKKKLIVKDGKVVGRAKAQRKDKGKTRITAYMMWAKEARNELLRKHPDMDFSAISKRLGEMWANVNYNERYLWKRKAKRFAMLKVQETQGTNKIISNPVVRPSPSAGPGRPAGRQKQIVAVTPPQQALVPVSANTNVTSSGMYRVTGSGALDVAAHLRLLGESLAIIGERLKEHEGQIAVSGSVSVLLDTLLCSLAPLLAVTRAVPAIAPPARLLQDTLHNIAYIMPGL
ncbi:HMG box-containing protein 4 isoform X2 [Colias croceus]|uniref:HMG box-containing protein 4 isoform X1 n=1 Tax=Colias crocea TaxID=72248 RepID=UPI001E27EFF1|nr:HMG box-containing protein 4 isoform X1 [Colias croceus]XP_045508762.1 HMG box-containing protein 4 isoform X2 [Colias croceus]